MCIFRLSSATYNIGCSECSNTGNHQPRAEVVIYSPIDTKGKYTVYPSQRPSASFESSEGFAFGCHVEVLKICVECGIISPLLEAKLMLLSNHTMIVIDTRVIG